MKPPIIAKLAISALGIFLSSFPSGVDYTTSLTSPEHIVSLHRWDRGLVFGAVILMWHVRTVQELISFRSGLFLVVSTLIFAWLDWYTGTRLLDLDVDGWLVGLVGITILLPMAQVIFLKTSWRRTAKVIPCVLTAWLVLWGTATGLQFLMRDVDRFYNTMTLWQVLYLAFMFSHLLGTYRVATGTVSDVPRE